MQFYQSNYSNTYGQQTGADSMMGGSAPSMGAMDSGFGTNIDVSGVMGAGELTPGLVAAFGTSGYPNEPPLLEEVGINFQHIKMKTLAVLNPMNRNIT
ncbi:MAG: hypothetical protein L0I88_07410, partial [Alkalibacterium sp.]|nr:hypothetical protein [Alkalibacterium sp.]